MSLRAIHVGLRALGITEEDDRRALYGRVTGKRSLREMGPGEHAAVLAELRRLGFRPGGHRKAAPRADLRLAHVLWRKLHAAGAVERAGAAGLNAFVRSRFGEAWGAAPIDVDAMREPVQIAAVLEALKAMCLRAGVRP
jgi:phage gp16-like protein